jgi:hypothetical protein
LGLVVVVVAVELDPLGRPVRAEESTAQRLRRVYELEPEADTATLQQQQQEQQQQEEQGQGEGDVVPEAAVRSSTQSPTMDTVVATTGKKASVTKKVKSATQTKAKAKKAAKAAKKPEPPVAAQEELDEGEETRRLAVCKCDWDKVRAVDILVLLQSFVPATGAIVAVTIYPSRLGQQRLDEEVISPPLPFLSQSLVTFPHSLSLSFLLSCSWWMMDGPRRVKAKHGPQGIFRDRRQGRGGATGEIDDGKLRQYEARHRRPPFLPLPRGWAAAGFAHVVLTFGRVF